MTLALPLNGTPLKLLETLAWMDTPLSIARMEVSCVSAHANVAAPVHWHALRGQIDSGLGPGPNTADRMSPAVTVSPQTTFSFACLLR